MFQLNKTLLRLALLLPCCIWAMDRPVSQSSATHTDSGYHWSKTGIPHSGWSHYGVTDLGHGQYQGCEMCSNPKVRYVHQMSHPNYGDIEVGCVCAVKMEEDSQAKELERVMRNKASRQVRWQNLAGWKISRKGNPYLKKDGMHITIFQYAKAPHTGKWGFIVTQHDQKHWSTQAYDTSDAAKIGSFEKFWALSS